jgi:hypothetical protein
MVPRRRLMEDLAELHVIWRQPRPAPGSTRRSSLRSMRSATCHHSPPCRSTWQRASARAGRPCQSCSRSRACVGVVRSWSAARGRVYGLRARTAIPVLWRNHCAVPRVEVVGPRDPGAVSTVLGVDSSLSGSRVNDACTARLVEARPRRRARFKHLPERTGGRPLAGRDGGRAPARAPGTVPPPNGPSPR